MSLDHLWAGWRSAYVGEVTAQGPPVGPGEGSLFEQILASGEPDEVIHVLARSPRCVALLNRYPYCSGHLMVMPQRAVVDIESLEPDEASELWSMVTDAVVALKAAYRCEGINIGLNLGRPAGAGVPDHLHVHVLPRWAGDTNFMTTVAQTRVLPEDLDTSWQKLRQAWPD